VFSRITLIAIALLSAAPAFAQIVPAAGMNITLAEAEQRALDRNPQIAEARLGAAAADFTNAEAQSAYSPTLSLNVQQRSQTNASTTQLSGGQQQVTNQTVSYGTGLEQRLRWGGGSLSLDFTGNRAATSNIFSTRNPSFGSGLTASLTQPLLRGFRFDSVRAQIETAAVNRSIADVQVRQQEARTVNGVRRAYWELVYAMDARETARQSEELAKRNLDENKLRAELGTVALIDVLEAEAEVASRHQSFVQAEGAWRNAQVNLKQLIVKDTTDPLWSTTLLPVERPTRDANAIDLTQAVTTALANRTDLEVARKQRLNTDTSL
jgi:outer membrane protein